MATKRAKKCDGSITEAKTKSGKSYNPRHWRIRIDLGTDATGKRRTWSKTIAGTLKDAQAVRNQKLRELGQGLKPDSDQRTFRELSEKFIKAKKESGNLSERRYKTDLARVGVLNDLMGSQLLKDITAEHLESLPRRIREYRESQGIKCGGTTQRSYFALVKAILKAGVRYKWIASNPADDVSPEMIPRMDPITRKSLTEDEYIRLQECIDRTEDVLLQKLRDKEHRQSEWGVEYDRSCVLGMKDVSCILTVRLGAITGARLGEILKLTWGDLKGNTITIDRQKTKTDSGVRRLALDVETLDHLRNWKSYQAELLDYIGIEQTDLMPIMCSATGSPLGHTNFENWWREWRTQNGFKDLLFHELRHSVATVLLSNGVDLKKVQYRLGHSNPAITLKFYAHAIPDDDQKTADIMADLLRGRLKKETPIIPYKTA